MQLRKTHIATIVVGGAIALGAGFAMLGAQGEQQTVSADKPVGNARLAVGNATVAVGQTVAVPVVLSTGGDATSGVDLVLTYDPELVEIVDGDTATAGTQIAASKLFELVQMNAIDTARGEIRFSAGQQPMGQPVTVNNQVIATITLKGKQSGTTTIELDHTAGALSDTNVIKANDGRDLLNAVQFGTVTVAQ